MQAHMKSLCQDNPPAVWASVCVLTFGLVLISRTLLTPFVSRFDLVLPACLPSAGPPSQGNCRCCSVFPPAPLPINFCSLPVGVLSLENISTQQINQPFQPGIHKMWNKMNAFVVVFSHCRVTPHTPCRQTSMAVFLPCPASTAAAQALRRSSAQLTPRPRLQPTESWVRFSTNRSDLRKEWLI